tara:strand:+ start:100318 stop:100779 length:462 start_codon:yes stop_codon:yes gene_type:complete
VSETERLFAALGAEVPEFEPTDWEFAAEEELIYFCNDAPDPRAGLRTEILIQLDRVDRGRELASRLTVMASFMLAAMLVVFGPSNDATQAEAVAQVEPARMAQFPLGSPASGPALLVEASRETDSWALVEAYSEIREQHRNELSRRLSGSTVQ